MGGRQYSIDSYIIQYFFYDLLISSFWGAAVAMRLLYSSLLQESWWGQISLFDLAHAHWSPLTHSLQYAILAASAATWVVTDSRAALGPCLSHQAHFMAEKCHGPHNVHSQYTCTPETETLWTWCLIFLTSSWLQFAEFWNFFLCVHEGNQFIVWALLFCFGLCCHLFSYYIHI